MKCAKVHKYEAGPSPQSTTTTPPVGVSATTAQTPAVCKRSLTEGRGAQPAAARLGRRALLPRGPGNQGFARSGHGLCSLRARAAPLPPAAARGAHRPRLLRC